MIHASIATRHACASAVSAHVDPVMAAEAVSEEAAGALTEGCCDLALLFASGEHAQRLPEISEAARSVLGPGSYLAVTGESIVGPGVEIERSGGVSLLALSMPGTTIHTFTYQQLPHAEPGNVASLARLGEAIGAESDLRGVLLFADPFSVPAASVLASMSGLPKAIPGLKRLPIVGGLASLAPAPGTNTLVVNDEVLRSGAVGVSIRGEITMDTMVSQGCRPIGMPMVVTKSRRNIVQELGGRRALDVVRELVESLDDDDKRLVAGGLFFGRAVCEYRERFGRGDFLVRTVMGVDQESGALAVGDTVRIGQTVQFHLRDARTAAEDLRLLLTAQQLQTAPIGSLLTTCTGRGTRLFGDESHDVRALQEAIRDPSGGQVPVAGFFASGEFGPIGDHSYLHGHTASAAFFRPRIPQHDD